MSSALQKLMSGAPWKRRRDRYSYAGSVRAIELTWGESNGWHPHVHVAVVFRERMNEIEVAQLREWIKGRWSSVVEARGFGTINEHGVDVRRVTSAGDLGSYLCKIEGGWSAGHELARGDVKKGGGRLTPFEMLTQLVETGESRWALLWREYERATYGRRAIMFSPGLRAELLGDVEQSDLELAASEGADLTLLRAMIERAVWRRRLDECTTGALLTSIEQTAAWLLWICDAFGIEVVPLDRAGPEVSRVGSPGGESRFSGRAGGVPLTPRRLVAATI
jgi:hypothetical protein